MNRAVQPILGIPLMAGGILVGVVCVVTLGASLVQPRSADSYGIWTVVFACCLASIGVSLYLRKLYKKSADDGR